MTALAPVALFCTSVFLSAVAVRWSAKDRLGLMGLSVSLALLAFRRVSDITSWAELSSLLGFFVLLWTSHTVKLLFLDKAVPPSDWKMTYKTLFDFRGIGAREKQDTKILHGNPDTNMSISSEKQESRRLTSSSKGSRYHRFLLKRLASIATIVLLNQAYTITYSLLLQLSYDDFHPSKQSYIHRFRDITVRETVLRSWIVFNFVWSSWTAFTAAHDILAFAHVAMGIDEPEDWPRLYGSIFEAYSVRKFWGKFCVNFSVFLISGIIHACVTVQIGFKCGYWEDVAFFVMCYAALVVEEGMGWAATRAFGRGWQNGWISRILGYVWVFGFLFWVLPKHQYPKVLCAPA